MNYGTFEYFKLGIIVFNIKVHGLPAIWTVELYKIILWACTEQLSVSVKQISRIESVLIMNGYIVKKVRWKLEIRLKPFIFVLIFLFESLLLLVGWREEHRRTQEQTIRWRTLSRKVCPFNWTLEYCHRTVSPCMRLVGPRHKGRTLCWLHNWNSLYWLDLLANSINIQVSLLNEC